MKSKVKTSTILKIFWQYVTVYPKSVIALLIITPLANITLRMIPPLIVSDILNKLTNKKYIPGDFWASFGNEFLVFAGLIILGGIFLWRVVIYLIWKLENNVQKDIYESIFKKYIELDSNFHSNSFGGSLVSRANKLAGAYVRIQDVFLFQFYLMLIAYIYISIIMYPKSHVYVWAMWLFTLIYVVFSLFISKKVRVYASEEANSQNKITASLADAVTNVMAIKSFARDKQEIKNFSEVTEFSRQKSTRLMWATTWRDLFSSTVTTTVTISSLLIAIIAVINYRADIGLVFLMFTYSADISERLWQFNAQSLRNFNRAIGDSYEAVETLLRKSSIKDSLKPKTIPSASKDIKFDKMTFSHNDSGENILFNDFNLDIKPGTKIGLVGHSGSGKTSLVRLLMRYANLDKGQILIGNVDISAVTQNNLHRHIAYVPQEPLLFHRSLAENIGYGIEHATIKDIERAAKLAHCHEFIKDLPNGYNTLVGERGVKLSGGQRQRVAIARAMLKDAPILVLDEATSALDSESEVLIQDALWKLMEGKTAIVIAHRLSTIQKMDRIIVLDNGQIVEEGSHTELLNKDGTYAKLWAHQSGGFLED